MIQAPGQIEHCALPLQQYLESCLVLIKAYRGQLWKGKQSKEAEQKNERKNNGVLFMSIKSQNIHLL